jgi:hypothetical protein
MPNTFIPIQTYTLSATTASVTFSNIPQNYTDLKVVVCARSNRPTEIRDELIVRFNNDSGNNYNYRTLRGTGSAAESQSGTSVSGILRDDMPASGATANTFSNQEIYIPNYIGSTTKSVSIDSTMENNASSSFMHITSGLWSNTAAITSVTLIPETSTFTANSTFTLYGISNGVKAVGGTLTVAGGYAYHTFTSTGSFLPSQQIKGAEILAIAGGGGGGGNKGGGGGAGGLRYLNSQTLNAGNSYTALVGSGGAGSAATNGPGGNGSNSVFLSLTSTGGGGGGGGDAGGGTNINGRDGGSGGGAANNGAGTPVVGLGILGQGNNGGAVDLISTLYPGGGGGAGGTGFSGVAGATQSFGGVGSSAYSVWGLVTGTGQLSGGNYYYAGGGGGGTGALSYNASGGPGGGGLGGSRNESPGFVDTATAGTANTGGGGGGGSTGASAIAGKAGGSGIIIIRYRLD